MSTSIATVATVASTPPPSSLTVAAENENTATTRRKSSASSVSSDLDDHGMPVQPYHDPIGHDPSLKPSSTVSDPSTLEPSMATHPPAVAPADASGHALRLALQSPKAAATPNAFTFEEIMSPRHQNGKRYLGGYMLHRVSMAGGFLKSWKRKYFRLRDHGLMCYKNADDTTPLFEIRFNAQSNAMSSSSSSSTGTATTAKGGHDDATMLASTRGRVIATLVLVLHNVEIIGHLTPATKVDMPVFLKAEHETEYHAWVENVRLKIEARKRAIAQDAVNSAFDVIALSSDAHTGESIAFSDSPASAEALNLDGEVSPSRHGEAVTSMPPTVQPTSGGTDKNKLLFVAGTTPDPPEFATFRSKYLLMKEIGEGSFSIVHRAVNRLTGQLCAVKCCKYSPALEEEVAILRRLSHPNVVGLEGVYLQDDMYYVVMDYMEEGDLCERLIQKQRLTESEAKVIIAQVLRGLEHLHRHQVLHRDLKPENILLHGGVVKIADFGLARQLPTATSMLKRSCGTLEYAAPELLRGQAYGLKSDIFSLGVVLYVLLFGSFPFTIESAALLQRMERFPEGLDVRDMSCLRKDNAQWSQVSRSAQDVLLRMLREHDKERISAKDLLAHPWFDVTQPEDCSASVQRDSDALIEEEITAEAREIERQRDCRVKGFTELLSRGLDVIKYAKAGHQSPHQSTLSIDFVHGTISWTARGGVLGKGVGSSDRKVTDNANSSTTGTTAKRGMRLVSFGDVQEIRLGHTTEAFRSVANGGRDLPAADLCVSIVATWRTLDFVVKAGVQREFLVSGMKTALEQYRTKQKTP